MTACIHTTAWGQAVLAAVVVKNKGLPAKRPLGYKRKRCPADKIEALCGKWLSLHVLIVARRFKEAARGDDRKGREKQ
jgi:hypothetical protein